MLETLHKLQKFMDVNGRAPTQEELSYEVGVSPATIWRHLHKLQDMGYITINGMYRIDLRYRLERVTE